MKRIIALLLAAFMLLTLVSCGKEEKKESRKEKLYKKYADIIECLEDQNYQQAITLIDKLARGESPDGDGDDGEDEPSEEVKTWSGYLVGDWIADGYAKESGYTGHSFREDGTCTVNGEEYTWEMLEDNISSTHAYANVLRDGTKKYQVSLGLDEDTDRRSMSLLVANESGGMSGTNGCFYHLGQYSAIELTVDNWQDYFEWKEYTSTDENSFGEVTTFSVSHCLRLKEEYLPVNQYISDVAVEFTYVSRCYEVEVDLSTMTYKTVGEEHNSTDPQTNTTKMGTLYTDGEANGYGVGMGGFSVYGLTESNVDTCWITSDIELVRIKGVIYVQNK